MCGRHLQAVAPWHRVSPAPDLAVVRPCLQVPYYDYALDLILDSDSASTEILTEEQHELVESAAEMLYGLIHVRFILTSRGMSAMFEKYKVTGSRKASCVMLNLARCQSVCCCRC